MDEHILQTLAGAARLEIDWELTPEEAAFIHMEQNDNSAFVYLPPVIRQDDVSRYFVVDTCEKPPLIRLQERSTLMLNALLSFPVPEELRAALYARLGNSRGTFAPPPEILSWLRTTLDGLSRQAT